MKRMHDKKQLDQSAEQIAEALIKSGQIDNAKPIYCHPLHFAQQTGTTKLFHLTCLIFNNNPTPFTLDSFKTFLDNLYEAVKPNEVQIMVSGGCVDSALNTYIASYIFHGSTNYGVACVKSDGSLVPYLYGPAYTDLFPEGTTLTDAVNKIN